MIICNDNERRKAYALVERVYKSKGYIGTSLDVTPYWYYPSITVANEDFTATISAIIGEYPLFKTYPELREPLNQYRLIEVGLFASVEKETLSEMLALIAPLFEFAKSRNCTHAICGINPERYRVYKRLWRFEIIGEQRTCLNGAPVAPCILPL